MGNELSSNKAFNPTPDSVAAGKAGLAVGRRGLRQTLWESAYEMYSELSTFSLWSVADE